MCVACIDHGNKSKTCILTGEDENCDILIWETGRDCKKNYLIRIRKLFVIVKRNFDWIATQLSLLQKVPHYYGNVQ